MRKSPVKVSRGSASIALKRLFLRRPANSILAVICSAAIVAMSIGRIQMGDPVLPPMIGLDPTSLST